MHHRRLGTTDLTLPAISFGAGPISGLMTGSQFEKQIEVISRAFELGIDHFDTAATYGNGASEQALGHALSELKIHDRVQIGTKVRLTVDDLSDIESAVRRSCESSFERLGVDRVALLQLHNSVTASRGDLPTSLSVRDVLGDRGVISAMEKMQQEGLIQACGFTGLGDMSSLDEILQARFFQSAQIPLNLLLPFSGSDATAGSIDVNYLELTRKCLEDQVAVIAIRLMAGGALMQHAPSPHTYKTKFFTLDVFERDSKRSEELAKILPFGVTPSAASIRYVLDTLQATTALIGFNHPEQVEEAVQASQHGPLEQEILGKLQNPRLAENDYN